MMEKWIADARLWYVARAISSTLSRSSISELPILIPDLA
jgi:hypothetical protein